MFYCPTEIRSSFLKKLKFITSFRESLHKPTTLFSIYQFVITLGWITILISFMLYKQWFELLDFMFYSFKGAKDLNIETTASITK